MADDSTTLREPLENRPRDLCVPDPRTDIIKFDYEKHVKDSIRRFNENNPSTSSLEQAVIAAALAWREADETNASQRCEELIAACDRYLEAQEK